MKKASTDNKNYKLKKVAEEIKLLHVTDPESHYFAIAILIHTGSFNDPDDCPGLAHLFEHCLFTGSENFPEDNQLTRFLDQHNGQVNAWTSTEQTVFYMKVHQAAAGEALLMFLDMLLYPLFSSAGINKEIAAIDSEFHNKRAEEQRRVQDVLKETCNPNHPFSRFSVGNREAFQGFSTEELQRRLFDWHQSWMTPDNIQLCTYSSTESEALEAMISTAMASITTKSGKYKAPSLPPLYTTDELQKIIFIQSEKQHLRLLLTFPLTHENLHYDEKYEALVSHLIGYEGSGSLLDFLKSKKWATQLICGTGLAGSNFTDFNIKIELTESGLENLESIIQTIFLFNQLLARSDLHSYFEEKARLNELAFSYHPPENPLDCVLKLVRNMDEFPNEDLLSGEYLIRHFDAKKLNTLLTDIRPTNMRILVIAPDAPANKESYWYKVPYSTNNVAFAPPEQALQEAFNDAVKLPEPNRYIAVPSVSNDKQSHLPACHSIGSHQFWIGRDTINSDAQGECFFSWRADQVTPTIQHVANKKLFSSTLEARLHDRFYSAQVAGLHFRVYSHQTGMGLHTSGFADKQLPLCMELIKEVLNNPSPCDNFELHKQEYLNTLQSSVVHKPLNRLFTVLQAIFVQVSWLPEDLAKHVQCSSFQDVVATQNQIFSSYRCESLIYGDFQLQEMEAFIRQCPLEQSVVNQENKTQIVLLHDTKERSINFPCQHHDSAYVYYLQSQHKSFTDQAKMMLMESLLAGYYFNWMRNEKQLGYQVGTGYMPFNEHPGTALYVQSNSSSVVQIDIETQQCLQGFCAWLSRISSSEWDRCRQNIVRQLNQDKVSFSVICQRFWAAIGRNDASFQTENRLQQIVMSLSLEEVVQWFHDLNFNKQNHFTLYSCGSAHCDTAHFRQPLEDIYQYK